MSYTPGYTKRNYVNGSAPSINAENLNAIETTLVALESNASTDSARLDSAITTIGTKASQTDLNALSTTVGTVQTSVSTLTTNLATESTTRANKDTELERSLNALWRVNKGQTYDYEEVSADSYSDTVISGGRIADVHKLGGKSVVWNQYADNSDAPSTRSGITHTYNSSDNSITVSGSASAGDGARGWFGLYVTYFTVIPTHKYLLGTIIVSGSYSGTYRYGAINGQLVDVGKSAICTISDTTDISKIEWTNNFVPNNLKIRVFCVDLTQMYGSGNEPTTTTDERIKAIESYASSHSSYNSGELISAKVTSVNSVGANKLTGINFANAIKSADSSSTLNTTDKTITYSASSISAKTIYTEFEPSTQYTLVINGKGSASHTNLSITYTDGTSEYVGSFDTANVEQTIIKRTNSAKTVSALVGAWFNGNTTLNYEKCAIIKGNVSEFIPSMEVTTTVPTSLQNIDLHSAGSVYDYFDFTEMKCHKKVGVVDLGSLSWAKDSGGSMYTNGVVGAKSSLNLIIPKPYRIETVSAMGDVTTDDKAIAINSSVLYVNDSAYTDATAFKTMLQSNNVKLYYELATEQITDITDDIPYFDCEGNGTITFIQQSTEVPIPHTIEYTVALGEVQ